MKERKPIDTFLFYLCTFAIISAVIALNKCFWSY